MSSSKYPTDGFGKQSSSNANNRNEQRRSMVTSTPVSKRYSTQRLVQKPLLSPICSNNEGPNENIDMTMSEYQYDGDTSRDLFANDTPPVGQVVENKQKPEAIAGAAGDDSDDVVADSIVEDSMDEVFGSFANASIREDDDDDDSVDEDRPKATLNRCRSPLVTAGAGGKSSMPSPAMCRSNANYTPKTMHERLMRKKISEKHAESVDDRGRTGRYSKDSAEKDTRSNDKRMLIASPINFVKKKKFEDIQSDHNDTASMKSFVGSCDEEGSEKHVDSVAKSESESSHSLSKSMSPTSATAQVRMRRSSTASDRKASESAKTADRQRIVESDSDDDGQSIFAGRKSSLNLDTSKASYQTPRRRVIIESDSEDGAEDSPFTQRLKKEPNVIKLDSDSDDQSNDSEPDHDIVQANDTLDDTIDLNPVSEPADPEPDSEASDRSADLTQEPLEDSHISAAVEVKAESSDDEVQVLESSNERMSHQSTHNSSKDASAVQSESLDDSIQVIEVKPASVVNEDAEKMRADYESRLMSLNQMKNSSRLQALPDKGARILSQIADIERRLAQLPPKIVRKIEPVVPKMFDKKPASGSAGSDSKERGPEIIPAPKMSSNDMERLINDKNKRLFGGKMTDNRMQNVFKVTGDSIEKIYQSLNTLPADTEEVETPKGLKIELMRHQKCGLAWMLWRERQVPPGGILADDMGLGKTLSMISLMLYQKNARHERGRVQNEEDPEYKRDMMKTRIAKERRLVPSNGTLVIAPASLILQWEKEIERRVKPGRLDVHVFHGPKNKREKNPKRLAQYDIVITTFNLAATELVSKDIIDDEADDEGGKGKRRFNDSSVLAQVLWDRVILDEAHAIKNRSSNVSRACCRISALNRWCLTGTPIHNELWDLYSLIRFLRVTPFDEEKLWKEYIMSGRQGSERLNTLVKGLLLRRTKAQIDSVTQKPLVDLKPRMFREVEVVLDGLEQKVYMQMFIASQQQVKQLLKNQEDTERYGMIRRQKPGPNGEQKPDVKNPFLFNQKNTLANRDNFQRMNCILVVLLKLRQACVHMALTRNHVDMDAFDTLGAENDPTMDLNRELAEMSIAGDELAKQVAAASSGNGEISEQIEALFEEGYKSAKVRVLLKELDKVLLANDKCVIVSQWTSMLSIVESHLKKRNAAYTSITGAIPTKDRQERVDSFNMPDGQGSQVMLLSLTAGGVGLNLIGGNHLFLLDLHWNPALENQACDRIYRMGQTKEVFIHKFICQDTIEQRVLDLQKKKIEMAEGVLEGAASKKLTRLNINDLKFLFDLNRPAPTDPPAAGPGTSAGVRMNAAPIGRPTASYAAPR